MNTYYTIDTDQVLKKAHNLLPKVLLEQQQSRLTFATQYETKWHISAFQTLENLNILLSQIYFQSTVSKI